MPDMGRAARRKIGTTLSSFRSSAAIPRQRSVRARGSARQCQIFSWAVTVTLTFLLS
jgi:alkylated DNA nucleotide flippase Atl1